ncbi:MAG: 4-hydroxy-3-methylbut-2-enyl diphosphate reductase [Treponema sp.]|nr:4-hydroxy-3-methylbut-2-enyl diphosphate reductase [Treponema sp.]
MKVIRAKVLGFCMGVRRAVDIAIREATCAAKATCAKESGSSVCTLGPLVHNPKVSADLEALGIHSIDESSLTVHGSALCESVIIRAHGINPVTEHKLRKEGYRIIDATCPHVKKNQLKIQELSNAGFRLFIAGEAEHAEIKGLLGYCEDSPFCEVTGSADEAREKAAVLYRKNRDAKTALLGQTTISEEEYKNIGEEIKKYFPDLQIIQTICAATSDRQNALHELLLQCDAVIVAGGKESANTRRLFSIAQQSGKPCALMEDAAQIPDSFLKHETVGICAGASTPDSVIEDIEQELIRISHLA